MSNVVVSASAILEASVADLYHILADYCHAHPAILPKPYFERLEVEQGGRGAGTVFRLGMNLLGQMHVFHGIVTEPVPGRVLIETDFATGQRSIFTLEPLPVPGRTRVTLASDFQVRSGLAGRLERYLSPSIYRRILRMQLQLLHDYAAAKAVWDREAALQVPG